MLHSKRPLLFLSILFGVGVHLLAFFFAKDMELHLIPPQRQGVLEWTKESPQESQKEFDRTEVLHAFFSPIAPKENPLESLVSTPEEQESLLQDDFGREFQASLENIHEQELTKEMVEEPLLASNDSMINVEDSLSQELENELESSKLLAEQNLNLDPAFGDILSKEIEEKDSDLHLQLGSSEEENLSNEDLALEEELKKAPPLHQVTQGSALLQATKLDSLNFDEWEKELLAASEIHEENFAKIFRGKEIMANSDTFDTKVEYLAGKKRGETLFRITLTPKSGYHFKRIKQNLYFLLDRSNSISKERYYKTRDALVEALDALHPQDTFNIILFDDSLTKLSKGNIPCSKENIQKAQSFLKAQGHGGFFASTDLYGSLDTIVPSTIKQNEVNTAILLSDGDTFLSLSKQRDTIGGWTKKNKGKVSLFSLAIGKKNNIPLLDVISSFNRGILFYAPTSNSIAPVLKNLILSLRNPLGKDFRASIVAKNPETRVHIFPRNQRLPYFYEGIPYVLYGAVSNQEELSLFLQGKHYDSWLDIQIPISFETATEGNEEIEKQYVIQKAYDYYEIFLRSGRLNSLWQAQTLLEPYAIGTAFEVR